MISRCEQALQHQAHETRTCPICGNDFDVPVNYKKTCCSMECSTKYRAQKISAGTTEWHKRRREEKQTLDDIDISTIRSMPPNMARITQIARMARERGKTYGQFVSDCGMANILTEIDFPEWVIPQTGGTNGRH